MNILDGLFVVIFLCFVVSIQFLGLGDEVHDDALGAWVDSILQPGVPGFVLFNVLWHTLVYNQVDILNVNEA